MITPQERRRLVLERDRRRKRIAKIEMRNHESKSVAWNMLPVKVLVPWHVDEWGCRARTVGNEA